MKSQNRRLILQSIIDGRGASRIALARETGLSPSTVTSLVAELLEEKVLVESGVTFSTGGRGRRELAINSGYGLIVVVEIGRQRVSLCTYDMTLAKLDEKPLGERRLSGNNLFFEISTAIFDQFYKKDENLRLAGIGLLFQEDMIESDLNVMFSTSLSADNISLREALSTQFRVPVAGEYSVSEVLNALETDEVKNSVHVALAHKVLVSLTIDGRTLHMREGKSADITGLLSSFQAAGPWAESSFQDNKHQDNTQDKTKQPSLLSALARVLALLCGLFTLDIILLSGEAAKAGGFAASVREILGRILSPATPPPIKILEPRDAKLAEKMARRIRNTVLGSVMIFTGGW
jgi:DNA-binding Lrp family transcriptional regulator